MKPKLIVVSGLPGVGKQFIASSLVKKFQTEIIVGDYNKFYKNYLISSNSPSSILQKAIRYNLLGHRDVFEERLVANKYKELILNEINRLHLENKVPIIEGGNGFYLNYLLTSTNNVYGQEKWDHAIAEARKIFEKTTNWDTLVEMLKEKCPTYDNSIPKNHMTKLETAFRYAVASNGETFTWRTAPEEKLNEIFDVRGFIVTIDPKHSKQAIADRCYRIMQKGMVEEFLNFVEAAKGRSNLNISELSVPSGFPELEKMVNGLVDLEKNRYIDKNQNYKRIFDLCKEFIGEFQIGSKRFEAHQRKYFRSKFKYFMWKEVENPTNGLTSLIETMYNEAMLPEPVFKAKVESDANKMLINRLGDDVANRKIGAVYDLKQDTLAAQGIINNVMPRVARVGKTEFFKNKKVDV